MTQHSHRTPDRQAALPVDKISDILRVNPRFMRSVYLETDILALESSRAFILTPVAQDSIKRILTGLHKGSTQRAWRLTGDYGTGKSEFALALARVLAGIQNQLPKTLRSLVPSKRLQPLVATGDFEPLACTVMRAIQGSCPTSSTPPNTDQVLAALDKAAAKARTRGFAGIFLILDELGKNLEYAARYAYDSDIYLLQRLAEYASRSADKPVSLLAILHQGVTSYANSLDSGTQREWAKVAGRFEEIVFAHPLGQVANLVAASMDVRTDLLPKNVRQMAANLMTEAVRLGFYGTSPTGDLHTLADRLFPLHPTTLPILVRAIRRFGQNERSIFSFLASAEPMALQSHASRPLSVAGFVRINHIFDYVSANLASAITTTASNTNWSVVEGVLSTADTNNETEVAVLKTIALLSLLDSPELPATLPNLLLALGDKDETVRKNIEDSVRALRKRGLVYERGAVRGLCLWPHTSVDLEAAFQRAKQVVTDAPDRISNLCSRLGSLHLVPRSHYVRTGTLRYAEARFIPAEALASFLQDQPPLVGKGPDIHIRIVLPLDSSQYQKAMKALQSAKIVEGLCITVARPIESAMLAFSDLAAWEWLKANTPDLNTDRHAREEVARQLRRAEDILHTRLSGISDVTTAGHKGVKWFHKDGTDEIASGKALLAFLGAQCDSIYNKAPHIQNELLNRRYPSGAAVSARTKLAEAMATCPDVADLGMDSTKRPPEMALYISLIKGGGFHNETPTAWEFHLPSSDKDRNGIALLPTLNRLTEILTSKGADAMVPVQTLFNELARPPFGIREGLHPLILALYLALHKQRVALYEDGTFLHHIGGEQILRLMKEPQFFHVQFCAVEGVRSEVFAKLLHAMDIKPTDVNSVDLLDLVRPLVIFVSREIPEYSRRTQTLPAQTIAVRRALLDVCEPIRLVFTALPESCGLPPITTSGKGNADELATRLRAAIHELQVAYSNLVSRISKALYAAFDLAGDVTDSRKVIASRAKTLANAVTEPSLKAFALRLADDGIADRPWLESIANLIVRKSPERWLDSDETEFYHQLQQIASRFRRSEMANIGKKAVHGSPACRVALTLSNGTEVTDLVTVETSASPKLAKLEDEFAALISSHGRVGLVAAVRALWRSLDTQGEVNIK